MMSQKDAMQSSKKFYLFRKMVKKRKIVIKIEFTPQTAKCYPFLKGFKKHVDFSKDQYNGIEG